MNSIQKWIEALRSGKYRQARGRLGSNDTYCCLGVACEVYQEEVGDLVVDTQDGYVFYDAEGHRLPLKVAEWLGFSPGWSFAEFEQQLINKNDIGENFQEIADYIEYNAPSVTRY